MQLSVVSGFLALLAEAVLVVLSLSRPPSWISQCELALSVVSVFFTMVASACWFLAACGSPGSIDPTQPALKLKYDSALVRAAAVTAADAGKRGVNWWDETGTIIHQLRIVGPERSRYCTATRRCIPVFDHYCVFLRAPVGRDNFAAFFATLVLVVIALTCLLCAAIFELTSWRRFWPVSVLVILYFGPFVCMWSGRIAGDLLQIMAGLTSYELIQMKRQCPAHLVDKNTGEFSNPYNKGFVQNLRARLCPRREAGSENTC